MLPTHRFVRIFAACCVALVAAPLAAETYFVRAAGDDLAAGTSPQTAFKTLLRAAQAFNHGDKLVIGPGTYQGPVLIAERFHAASEEMSIVGDESGQATGDGAGPVVIVGNSPTDPALHLLRMRNLRIAGLTVRGSGQGLKVEKCRGVTVERSTFSGLTRGLIASGSSDVRIESCVFARTTIGLFAQGCVRMRVAHVTLAGSTSVGLLALSCGPGEIRNSLFTENNTNLTADAITAAAWTSDHNVLAGTSGAWGDVPTIAKPHEWNAASGQDRHSVHVVPGFVDPEKEDLHIASDVSWGGGLPGSTVGVALEPAVKHDRDGHPFVVRDGAVGVGAYAYPEPQPAAGWRRVAEMPRGGIRQSAGVYRADGTLVRMLLAGAAGVRDLWWDGRDDLGVHVPAGKYQIRTATHDVQIVDDGAMGDDGNPLGAYNCDNADRVVALPDGGFVITTHYDEAGYPLRKYSSSGQPIFAANLTEKDFAALALDGDHLYGVVGQGAAAQLIRLKLPGDRAPMQNGAESYPLFAADEKPEKVAGLAIVGKKAFVSAPGLSEVRIIDLETGKQQLSWPLPSLGDIAADGTGHVWVVVRPDVLRFNTAGQVVARFPTGLENPRYLAATADRVVVIDRQNEALAILDKDAKYAPHVLGAKRTPGAWTPIEGALVLRDPRGAAFLPDGRLIVTEQARLSIFRPEAPATRQQIMSNFMDVAVVHPTQPEIVYCALGAFHVDPQSGAWRWLVEEPRGQGPPGADGKPTSYYLGSPATTVVLAGRPFVAYFNTGRLRMLDVSEPTKPRLALDVTHPLLNAWAYATIAFGKGGELIVGGNYTLQFDAIPFQGLDAGGNPTFDFTAARKIGTPKDASPRDMKSIAALAADPAEGDLYYLAVTAQNNKMVPGWGADGTGVGKSGVNGEPLWFSPSSGGNYMSISMVRKGSTAWILAGKSFGGQIDLFDGDGLRLTTGNWNWPTNYGIGFVDLRFGVHAYVRPDGKVGAYVEDDAIGRFARCRIERAETLLKKTLDVDWAGAPPAGAPRAAALPDAERTAGKSLAKSIAVPRVPALPVDGDWHAWEKAQVVPQIVCLPAVGFRRFVPEDLWQTFRAGTALGAVAHDGRHVYVYFVVADDSPHFDAEQAGVLWMFDGIELWIEEEQFGLGLTKNGQSALYKFRHHNREGKQFAANYPLAAENVWGTKLADLGAHPLGRQLASITGVSFAGKPGYAAMGRIPMSEIKLVGGIAGRTGTDIVPLTGAGGEVLRIGVSLGCLNVFGHEQDYKVNWPSTLMFSDPTRSAVFELAK